MNTANTPSLAPVAEAARKHHEPKQKITLERAREVFDYDPRTGVITRKIGSKRSTPYEPRPSGYISIRVDKRDVYGHHLAWLMTYGTYPTQMLDHADTNKSNNAISNLRLSDCVLNGLNHPTKPGRYIGVKSVSAGSHAAFCGNCSDPASLIGYFKTSEEAACARDEHIRKNYPGRDLPLNFSTAAELEVMRVFVYVQNLIRTAGESSLAALIDAPDRAGRIQAIRQGALA